MPLQSANETELYYELRGTGPALLLIMGATGSGGVFDRFAELLADDFTVVTYDRRGNGRSPSPSGWSSTSTEEQADDAAALLNGLCLKPAAIFGTSSEAVFALAALSDMRARCVARYFMSPRCSCSSMTQEACGIR